MEAEMRSVTKEELGKHNREGDLWVSIHGKIYDVSKWASTHPGGDLALKSFAGQADATDAFLAFHPPRAYAFLPKFEIGTLSNPDSHPTNPITEDHKRVHQKLNRSGLFKVDIWIYCKIMLILLFLLVGSISGVVFSSSKLVHCISAVLLGIVWSQAGWIGHDLGHTGITGNSKTDSYLGLLVGNLMSGIGFSWWTRNHNAHHYSCNSVEYDPDVQYVPIFAVSSELFGNLYSYFYRRVMPFDALARLLVSYQHLSFYPVMAVARINLYAQSFLVAIYGGHVRDRRLEISTLIFFYIWVGCLLSYLPTNLERMVFVLLSLGTTGIQHVQFCLNHFSSKVYRGTPYGDYRWVHAQSEGTLNIECSSKWDWFHGGLQFQIEHHLFPKLPRHNLRKASEQIIKPMLIDKHGLAYTAVSFWQANVMIVNTLRSAALQARATNKSFLLWQAVNALG